ncbi:Fetal globin-inducing factor (Contains ankyrin repeats) [Forsythia ovata]|uniref:Fetal globin-inducing factor (Contains ankyrin repeats) n=1 Tax=Forsythia ovata TaxID=205694 RepID=A0ABD1WFC0_9LAMI
MGRFGEYLSAAFQPSKPLVVAGHVPGSFTILQIYLVAVGVTIQRIILEAYLQLNIIFTQGVEFAEEDDINHFDIHLHLCLLVAAIESGDLNTLHQALDNFDSSIDEPVEDGDTVLHLTCLYGHLSWVQFLLER